MVNTDHPHPLPGAACWQGCLFKACSAAKHCLARAYPLGGQPTPDGCLGLGNRGPCQTLPGPSRFQLSPRGWPRPQAPTAAPPQRCLFHSSHRQRSLGHRWSTSCTHPTLPPSLLPKDTTCRQSCVHGLSQCPKTRLTACYIHGVPQTPRAQPGGGPGPCIRS